MQILILLEGDDRLEKLEGQAWICLYKILSTRYKHSVVHPAQLELPTSRAGQYSIGCASHFWLSLIGTAPLFSGLCGHGVCAKIDEKWQRCLKVELYCHPPPFPYPMYVCQCMPNGCSDVPQIRATSVLALRHFVWSCATFLAMRHVFGHAPLFWPCAIFLAMRQFFGHAPLFWPCANTLR